MVEAAHDHIVGRGCPASEAGGRSLLEPCGGMRPQSRSSPGWSPVTCVSSPQAGDGVASVWHGNLVVAVTDLSKKELGRAGGDREGLAEGSLPAAGPVEVVRCSAELSMAT